MRVWLLYKDIEAPDPDSNYEVRRFKEVADREGIELRVLVPDQFDLIVSREDKKSVRVNSEAVELPDVVIPYMSTGTSYFGLAILRHLERLGVYCLNHSHSIENARDKLYSQQILAQSNLPIPKTMLIRFPVDVKLVEGQIGFPVVVKMLSGSLGKGVFLSETRNNFLDLMHLIEETNRTANLIIQEFVATSRGRDLRVFTVGGRVVACMQRTAPEGDFKANFSQGGSVSRHDITPEIEWLGTKMSQIFNLDLAGFDLLFDGEHYKVCEANASPGFKGLESCCDIDVPREIFHFIRIRQGLLKRRADDPAGDPG